MAHHRHTLGGQQPHRIESSGGDDGVGACTECTERRGEQIVEGDLTAEVDGRRHEQPARTATNIRHGLSQADGHVDTRRVIRSSLLRGTSGDLDELSAAAGAPSAASAAVPRSAALVVGSAKTRGTSVSENIARALADRLETNGVPTTLHAATDFVGEGRAATAAHAVAEADLFVLVTPLYVDALPALATHALECVARARADAATPARFAAVINCGFPEPEHNRTALRIARHFAASAHYHWAGGLPLGGGGAVNPGVPLDALHGPAEHVKKALDLAAPCLARGEVVPSAAIEQMAASPMPDMAYRLMGDAGWRYQAHKNGLAQAALRARPLD